LLLLLQLLSRDDEDEVPLLQSELHPRQAEAKG
jgi:hypothetical protein